MQSTATFGAGCFWSVEDIFRKTHGVVDTTVGYMGGTNEKPTYEDVCTNKTGHAEVVEVTYNPEKVTYEKLLDIFWKNHNPTTKDRQGLDVGTQYRSVIFVYDADQRSRAEESRTALEQSAEWPDPIVTEILPATKFWRAEEYHQQYFAKKGIIATCEAA